MLKMVEGDILLSKAQAVAHGIAPNDDFKNGLALSLRERWPAMYKDFRHYCQTCHPKAGTLWTWSAPNGLRIISLFTQENDGGHHGNHPGPASLPNVVHCLKALRKECGEQKFTSLALPRLSTGVGGLAWKDVEPLIGEYLATLPLPIFVYATFRQGVAAHEVP